MDKKITEYWNEFIKTRPLNVRPTRYSAWAFGNTPEMNDKLGNLVLHGPKRATTSLKWIYERFPNEKKPGVGDYNVILNSSGEPFCTYLKRYRRMAQLALCMHRWAF